MTSNLFSSSRLVFAIELGYYRSDVKNIVLLIFFRLYQPIVLTCRWICVCRSNNNWENGNNCWMGCFNNWSVTFDVSHFELFLLCRFYPKLKFNSWIAWFWRVLRNHWTGLLNNLINHVPGGMTGSPNLHWLRLPVVDTNTCAESYARFSANSRTPIIVGNGQLCVQGRTNVDACQGINSFDGILLAP